MTEFFTKKLVRHKVNSFKSTVTQLPKNALVELTNACNHACIFCYNPEMKRRINNIDIKVYEKFIIKCAKEGVEELGLYSTGEPFMTKNLDEFIKIAKINGIKRVYITTNGALATLDKVKKCIESGLDSIKFSINAGSNESYKAVHGHDDFNKVIKNLLDIFNYKTINKIKLELLCSFVITKLSEKTINEFKNSYQIFFDEEIRFYEVANQGGRTTEKKQILSSNPENIKNEKKFDIKKEYKPCEMLWNRLHLTSEGNLTACCVDYENDLVYEKFSEKQNILDQFNSIKLVKLREKHLNNKLENTICYNCIYNQNQNFEKIDQNLQNLEIKDNHLKNKKKSMSQRLAKVEGI